MTHLKTSDLLPVATVDFVRHWMMSSDHPISDWEREFAAAIDARISRASVAREDDDQSGCICPPNTELTCANVFCPRKNAATDA